MHSLEIFELLFTRWLLILVRAALVLGSLTLIFWIIKPQWIHRFRIPQPRVSRLLTREEIPRTILSLSVYILPIASFILAQQIFGYSVMYESIAERGWVYFFASIFIFCFLFDAWFYWAHRLMHKINFLKRSHLVHHRSYNVTPVSAYSFHYIEAILSMMPYWFFVMVIPWHPLALFVFSIIGLLYNGYIHLGYDFGVNWRRGNTLLKWLSSSTHHSVHHQTSDGNFAFFFTFWDKLMKTER